MVSPGLLSVIKGLTLESCTKALFDQLVAPTLKLKRDGKIPPPEIQDKVAKQMYAVALLYNYFFRQQYVLEEIDWTTFCKRTPILSREMLPFLNKLKGGSMQKAPTSYSDLSRMEKSVKEAYETSNLLIKLKTQPEMMDKWPIAKVAVFVVDSQNKKCILLQDAVTEGCFSLVEKEIVSVQNEKQVDLNVIKSTVSDMTGIDPANFQLATESKLVYSFTKPKTRCKLFYARCIKEISRLNDTAKWVSFSEALECAKKSVIEGEQFDHDDTDECFVQYFHLEPFIPVLEEWTSKKFQFTAEDEDMKTPTNDNSDHSGGKWYDDCYNNDMPNGNTHSKENGKFSVSDRKKHPYDHNASETLGGRAKRFKESEDQKTNSVIRRTFLHEENHKVNIESNGVKATTKSMPKEHQNGIKTNPHSHDVNAILKKHDGLIARQTELQTELNSITEQIEELHRQHGAILSDFDSPATTSGIKRNGRHSKPSTHIEGRRTFLSACKDLDDYCKLNRWKMHFKTTEEGHFSSTVIVEGPGFDYSFQGDCEGNKREARESAAARMLKELYEQREQS